MPFTLKSYRNFLRTFFLKKKRLLSIFIIWLALLLLLEKLGGIAFCVEKVALFKLLLVSSKMRTASPWQAVSGCFHSDPAPAAAPCLLASRPFPTQLTQLPFPAFHHFTIDWVESLWYPQAVTLFTLCQHSVHQSAMELFLRFTD
jgi:hypothetical protein